MKILMINSVCGVSSTGRICTDLADELEKLGHTVKIAYGRGDVPQKYKKYAVKIGSDTGVILHVIKSRLFDASGFGSRYATKRFIEWVKKYNPDVIHLHNIHGYYINIEVLFDYLRTCGKKIIWTLHDCWAFTGHTPYCDSVCCEKWKDGCGKCPLKKEYPKAYIDRSQRNLRLKHRLFENIGGITLVTPSNWLKGLTEQSFLNMYPLVRIPNGIDTTLFKKAESDFRERYGLADKTVLLGVSSQWDWLKGFGDYIKLSGILDDRFRIILVGVTKSQKQSLPENIIGIENTDSVNELVEIYSASDYLLNFTYTDNFPTVNIEAVSCGVPVITYDTGGSAESSFGNAVVIERGDWRSAAKAVEKNSKDFTVSVDRCMIDKRMTIKLYLELYSARAQKTAGGI